jgi:chromate transporter
VIGFGGPAVHAALMEDEVVRRRRWLTREAFLDLLGATALIPGPNSTELAMHIGRVRAGGAGLLVAGLCFITPAALIVAALAWAYVRWGALPAGTALLDGVQPVVLAVLVQALWGLGRTALRTRGLVGLAALVVLGAIAGLGEVPLVLGAGAATLLLARARSREHPAGHPAWLGVPAVSLGGAALTGAAALPVAGAGLGTLFLAFLKIGAVLFGSGYVLVAFLRTEFVERLGWLTGAQLLDAIAVGQVTPGPVFTTATFVGWLVAGGAGAMVATVGIFLPAFVFVALTGGLVERLRASPSARAALDGVNVASLAVMAVASAAVARTALDSLTGVAIFAVAAALLLLRRVGATWLVLGGAALGLARAAIG